MRALVWMVALWAGAAQALCPAPHPTRMCHVYFDASKIFVGTVTRIEYVEDHTRMRYTVRTSKALRGDVQPIEVVHSENDSGRWPAWEGKTYIVFSQEGRVGGTCGSLDDPAYVKEALREIEALKRATTSSIEGEVLHRPNGRAYAGLAGKTIAARGNGVEYQTTTDDEGSFRLTVRPGDYELDMTGLWPTLLSNDNPRVHLVRGQCAQFQLEKH